VAVRPQECSHAGTEGLERLSIACNRGDTGSDVDYENWHDAG